MTTPTVTKAGKPLVEGGKAPAFMLPIDQNIKDIDHKDGKISLKDFAGSKVVVYFYPKDDTPGCTKEAIGFSQSLSKFKKAGVHIIGVSKDPLTKHTKFRDKHDLTITLASDEEGTMIEKYGCWVEKNMYGRKYMGIERATFLIDEKGKIIKIWRKVRVAGHVEAVLEAIEST